jgi:hypothetical protein
MNIPGFRSDTDDDSYFCDVTPCRLVKLCLVYTRRVVGRDSRYAIRASSNLDRVSVYTRVKVFSDRVHFIRLAKSQFEMSSTLVETFFRQAE